MPTAYHVIIGTDHPFASALAAALQTVFGGAAVRTVREAAALPALAPGDGIGRIYLLSGIFPAGTAEHPSATWHRSLRELLAVLDFARQARTRVFWPSSIAVFGSSAPAECCPIDAPQQSESFFAISRRAGEQWCRHYHEEHGVDVRCLRFPVLVRPAPGPPLPEPTPKEWSGGRRPVLHVEDAVRATLALMVAPPEALRRRIYHVSGASVSVTELLTEVRRHDAAAGLEVWNLPEHPGPRSLDDSAALADWGWKPRYDGLHLVKSLLHAR